MGEKVLVALQALAMPAVLLPPERELSSKPSLVSSPFEVCFCCSLP